MKNIKEKANAALKFITTFVKWVLISIVVGVIGGAVGTLFYICVKKATVFRIDHSFTLWLLPFGRLALLG